MLICRLLIFFKNQIFKNSFTLVTLLKEFFEKFDFEKISRRQKCSELNIAILNNSNKSLVIHGTMTHI